MIKPNAKLHVQYLEQLTEKAHETFKAMLYVEQALRGHLTTEQVNEWHQLRGHFAEGVHGLQVFTDEVKK